jgi:hypothetical protein
MWSGEEPELPSLRLISDAMPVSREIILLSPAITARMKYITRFVSTRLECNIKLIRTDQFKKDKLATDQVVLNYSPKPLEESFTVFSDGLMFRAGIEKQHTEPFRKQGQVYLYPAPEGFSLPFDLFSACFFLLSRYEEYLPFEPDRYGRFEAGQSLGYEIGFLEEPVVDQWLHLFKISLQQKFPGLTFPGKAFRFTSTFDIDNPWAFHNKGLIRNVAGSLKALLEGRHDDFHKRLRVLRGSVQDPFDNYDYIQSIEKKYHFISKFFFLFGDYDRLDSNYTVHSLQFKNLVQQVGRDHEAGIHPSLRSNDHARVLSKEYKRYSAILGKSPEISRQHFLILRFPETYRRLIEMGIKEDYSMGYASHPGFRAGTSSAFNFYDLAAENETGLVVFPFAVMDVTLQQYLSLSPNEALDRIRSLIQQVKLVNGTFLCLWHNESLSGEGIWKGWRAVFEGMAEEVRSKEQGVRRDER